MHKKYLFYIGIILFPFFWSKKAEAQEGSNRRRQVTVNQTIVDGKVVSSDTIIFETDTIRQRAVQSKEISMELPYTKGATLYIDNTYRKLNIRQSKDNKVRLSTTAFFYAEPAFTNEQWFEKLNIQVKNTDTSISIISGGINRNASKSVSGYSYQNSSNDATKAGGKSSGIKGLTVIQNGAFKEITSNGITTTQNGAYHKTRIDSGSLKEMTVIQNGATQWYTSGVPDAPTPPPPPAATSSTGVRKSHTVTGTNMYGYATTDGTFTRGNWISSGNTVAVFDEKGNIFYSSTSLKRELTIYIPAGVKLNVTSKYADVLVDHDVTSIKANISNASLDMLNATNAIILSNYGTVSASNFTIADISANNGKLSMKNTDQLKLNTKYTKVEADKCNTLVIKSTSDDYDIDEVKNISGTKTYGNLRLDKLTGSFDLKGSSADVKIKNIAPSVSVINLDNKYADVQLPVNALKNYEVLFSGNYSSVFAPFERKDTAIDKITESNTTLSYTTSDETVVAATKPNTAPAGQNGTIQQNDDNYTIYTTTDGSIRSVKRAATTPRNRTNSFTAAIGDTNGIHTIFKLVCNSCNVDFK